MNEKKKGRKKQRKKKERKKEDKRKKEKGTPWTTIPHLHTFRRKIERNEKKRMKVKEKYWKKKRERGKKRVAPTLAICIAPSDPSLPKCPYFFIINASLKDSTGGFNYSKEASTSSL